MRSRAASCTALAVLFAACFPGPYDDPCVWLSGPEIQSDRLDPLIVAPGGALRFFVGGRGPGPVTAEPPGTVSLVQSERRNEVDVRAIAEGVATLTVEDVCGKTATATVEVRPVASVSLAVHLGGLPGSFAMPAETTAPGIVVLPEARAYVAATPRDALGRRIYDAGLTWSSTAPSTLLDYGEYDEETGIYTAAVQPDEGVAGAVVSSSAGGELNVAFPPEAEVADALLLDWHGNGPLTNVEVPAGASFAIEFFPLDGLARPIFGAPSEEPGMTVDDDRVATGSCCGVWDATAIPQFRIQGLVQGETGVTLTAFGQTRTLDVRVSAP